MPSLNRDVFDFQVMKKTFTATVVGQKFIRKTHASTSQTSSCFRLPDTFKLDLSFNYNLEPHKYTLTIPYLHRDYTALASVANSSREQLEMPK